MFPFDPPEIIRKPKVFRCFQGDQKGTLGRKGLRYCKVEWERLTLVFFVFFCYLDGAKSC